MTTVLLCDGPSNLVSLQQISLVEFVQFFSKSLPQDEKIFETLVAQFMQALHTSALHRHLWSALDPCCLTHTSTHLHSASQSFLSEGCLECG